jgi:hypothetical protein
MDTGELDAESFVRKTIGDENFNKLYASSNWSKTESAVLPCSHCGQIHNTEIDCITYHMEAQMDAAIYLHSVSTDLGNSPWLQREYKQALQVIETLSKDIRAPECETIFRYVLPEAENEFLVGKQTFL